MMNPIAARIGNLLEKTETRVVFAESCSGGMAAALMTQVPGISQWFCGSAVTYRIATKQDWLNAPPDTLQEFTAESQPVSDALAIAVLENTPEAEIAGAITGHLGPGAEPEKDGVVFISIARRRSELTIYDPTLPIYSEGNSATVARKRVQMKTADRIDRQIESAEELLKELERYLTQA